MNVIRKLLMGLFLAVMVAGPAEPAAAQGTRDGGALLATGAEKLKGGQYQQARRALTQAMRSDTLSPAQIAKALYLRGVAQRHLDQPAQAISDLTSAMWLQGLSKKELAQARINRGLAYQAVGQNDLSRTDLQRAKEIDPNSKIADASPSTSPAAAVTAFDTRVETAVRKPRSPATPGFQTEVTEERVVRAKPKPAPIPSFQTQVQIAAREVDASPALRSSIVPDEKKSQPSAQPQQQAERKGRLSGLWDRARGRRNGDEPAAAPAAPTTPTPATPATSSQWTQTTKVDPAAAQPSAPQVQQEAERKGRLSGLWDRARGRDDDKPSAQTAAQTERPVATPAAPARTAPATSSQWTQTTKVDPAAAQPSAPQVQQQAERKGRLSGLWDRARGRGDDKPAAAQGQTPPASSSQWTQTTKVDPASRQARAPLPPGQPAAASAGGGRSYLIQLASVRSQSEADSTWKRLAAKHSSLLSGRQPIIERKDVGTLGTFYRIQIGPFADKKESARLCNTFKSSGVDCFLVAR